MNLRKLFPLLFLFPIAISSQNFVVNSILDTVDDNPGNGLCDDGAGNCTLRAAIEESNALAGTHQITFSVNGTITLGSMLPPLNTNINIDGPGTGSLTISGDDNTRIFYAKNGNIMITDVTLANGLAMGGSGVAGGGGGMGAGGALLMHEGQTGTLNVQIMNVVFENNQATGGYGADGDSDDDYNDLGGGGGGLNGNGGGAYDEDDNNDSGAGGGGGGGFFGAGGEGGSEDDNAGGGGGFFTDGSDGGDGGDGGGGGAPSGQGGLTFFTGEMDGMDAIDDAEGGDGGFGGGGGGGVSADDDSQGGDGGFAGGGGGAVSADDDSQGGDGGFGGGGGAAESDDDSDGGNGGFGGGGGSAEDDGGDGGYGAGEADDDSNGGGGMGAGGAIFVVSGQLAIGDVTFTNNSSMYGEGGDSDNEGEGLGGAIFVYGKYLYDDPEDDSGELEIQDDAFYEVDGKLNATVGIKAGSNLTFINNSATDEDNDDDLIVDGETINNNDNVFGAIISLAPIPTLGEWGILLLSMLLLTFGISTITKKEALLQGNKRSVGIEISNMLPFIGLTELKDNIINFLAITTIIVMMVFLVWGKVTLIDALGIPVISYLVLNLISLIKKNS